jgi:hypothetical protein
VLQMKVALCILAGLYLWVNINVWWWDKLEIVCLNIWIYEQFIKIFSLMWNFVERIYMGQAYHGGGVC